MDDLFDNPKTVGKTVGKLGNDTKAFWEPGEPDPKNIGKASNWPQFLTPSGVKYHRSPFKDMADRGIENRLMESLAQCLPNGTIIAGGFMTAVMGNNTDAQDIDLFFTSPDAFAKAFNTLLDPANEIADYDKTEHWAAEGYTLDTMSKASFLFRQEERRWICGQDARFVKFIHPKRPPIQLIKLAWYDNAEHVIDSFDLTVAQFAYDVDTGELICNPISIMDLLGKKIVLHRMQFPSSTLRRIIKYTKKGYYACPGSLAKVAQLVSEHIDDDESQFVYVD